MAQLSERAKSSWFPQVESGYTEAELQKTEMQHRKQWMKLVGDGDAHLKWVTPFFQGSILHIFPSLYCFQNLAASVKQIGSCILWILTNSEQIQAIAGRPNFQPASIKAQETYSAVDFVLFHKGKFVCVLSEQWMVALCLGKQEFGSIDG